MEFPFRTNEKLLKQLDHDWRVVRDTYQDAVLATNDDLLVYIDGDDLVVVGSAGWEGGHYEEFVPLQVLRVLEEQTREATP